MNSVTVSAASAVLTAAPDHWQPADHWCVVEPARAKKTVSPSAAYAEAAVALLPELSPETGLVTIAGATGMTADVFDRALPPGGGPLLGEGFGSSRYKRIHPFTLVRCLQNQAASHLSLHFGLRGPCLNLIDSETALALAPVHVSAMLQRTESVLLVLTSAPDRDEEAAKTRLSAGNEKPLSGALIEGAAAFLCTTGQGIGEMDMVSEGVDPQLPPLRVNGEPVITPIMRAGWALVAAIHGEKSGILSLSDHVGLNRQLRWRHA